MRQQSRLDKLEGDGLAKILIAGGNPPANPAKKFGVLYKGLVFFGITYLKTQIVQIAQVLVVTYVWQACFCHSICLLYKGYVSSVSSVFRRCIIAKPSTMKSITIET
jgi:hypothetical protein